MREELRDSSLQLVGVVVEDGVFGDVRLVFVVVGESAEVFYYGVEKTYTLEHVINDATVSAPQGWTATYDAANNELTVSSPATAGTGAKSGAVVVKGTDNIKREATATLNVTVREPDAYAFADEAFRNYLAKNYGGEDGAKQADMLIDTHNGEAALLFLLLQRLNRGASPEELRQRLGFSALQLAAAERSLMSLNTPWRVKGFPRRVKKTCAHERSPP